MTLTFQEIAEILKAIDESQAEEINIEVEGLRLSVKKRTSTTVPTTAVAPPTPTAEVDQATPDSKSDEQEQSKPKASPASPLPESHSIIRSPMVGTFYRRPSPDSDPFVQPGSKVTKGEPLCLIEVMKLYTTIESTMSGSIVSIFAEDGQLVEFDQQLFLIETY